MRQILHIIKAGDPKDVLRMIEESSGGSRPTLLLVQEAVALKPETRLPVFLLQEDAAGAAGSGKVGYGKMLELILDADSVKVW